MRSVARARFQRISVRKARAALKMIRGKNAAEAVAALRYTPKSSARIVAKVLDSALANVRDSGGGDVLDRLVVSECFADKAPDRAMRRWRPRAMGRATRITKGMSHVTVVLGERGGA